MPRGKKATYDCGKHMEILHALLGTPKHAYAVLRLKEIGLDFGVFYRAWRSNQTTQACSQVLGIVVPELAYEIRQCLEEHKGQLVPERITISDGGVARAAYWVEQERRRDDEALHEL